MTTKEKVIHKSISQIEKKLEKINFILNARPISEICNIRQETKLLLEENKTIEQRTSKEFMLKIEELSKREKEQFKLAKQSQDSYKLIVEKVDLESELLDLKNELYYINRK